MLKNKIKFFPLFKYITFIYKFKYSFVIKTFPLFFRILYLKKYKIIIATKNIRKEVLYESK
jgi:hypothetical protein